MQPEEVWKSVVIVSAERRWLLHTIGQIYKTEQSSTK